MPLDANLLLYAVHKGAPQHEPTAEWMTEQLNSSKRVGFPWQILAAFLRISTHPRAFQRPLAPATAWSRITDWLSAPVAWIPQPGPEHARILGKPYEIAGNLVPDAQLAALALEHGVPVCSTDTDFARFRDLGWIKSTRLGASSSHDQVATTPAIRASAPQRPVYESFGQVMHC